MIVLVMIMISFKKIKQTFCYEEVIKGGLKI